MRCGPLLCALVFFGVLAHAGAARAELFGFQSLREIQFPYDAGVASANEIAGTRYAMQHCVPQDPRIAWLKRPKGQFYKPDRIVVASVPAHLDLTNGRLVNGVLVQALRYAWKRCQAWQEFGRDYEFGGIEIGIQQRGKLVVRTEPAIHRSDTVTVGRTRNALIEQQIRARQEQQRAAAAAQAAERAQAWQGFLSSLGDVGQVLFFAGLAVLGWRYLPPVFTRIKWFFAPHPAIRRLAEATRPDVNEYVDGKLLAEALNFRPANDTEAKLAQRDLEVLRKRVNEKHARLRESEKLIREVSEMERAKVRVDVLKRAGGSRG